MISNDIKEFILKSRLCWLGTSYKDIPNVSPKEMFTITSESIIYVGNIASPISRKNIQNNPKVCLTFINPFIQKGYKILGDSVDLISDNVEFIFARELLETRFSDKFPLISIFKIIPTRISKIIAPSYLFYPNVSENQMIKDSIDSYKILDFLYPETE